MSLSMINAVLKNSKATGTDRMVLIVLAHHVNEESDACFPSRETICREAGIKERNLIYCLKKLESLKEIEIERGLGRGNLTQYRLKLNREKVQPAASFNQEKGAKESMQSPAPLRNKRCNPASQKVQSVVEKGATDGSAYKEIELKETEKEPCTASPSATRRDDPFFERFKTAFEATYGCPYQYRQADFVQLASCKKQGGGWLTLDRWQTGVDHYFASEIGTHTLADLSARFGTFFRSTLDRYGKPKTTTVNGREVDAKTAANVSVIQQWIDEKTKQQEEARCTMIS